MTASFKKYSLSKHVWVLLLLMIQSFLFSMKLQAQTAQLSPAQWKALEGVFQNGRNKEMYVQFTAKDDYLLAKLLWNNNELKLYPEAPLEFTSKEEVEGGLVHMSFKKDSAGNISQAVLNKDNVWNRSNDYKPVIKKEMQHTAAQLKPYEGVYRLQGKDERFIQLTEKENSLILKQHWDAMEIKLSPETEADFFSKETPLFTVSFTKDSTGNIAQVVVRKRDKWNKIKRTPPSGAEIKAIEGKYQFKDDPDSYIQVTGKKDGLVIKQLWDKKEITLESESPVYFYNNEQSYPLQVIKNSNGEVTQLVILGIDVFNKVK